MIDTHCHLTDPRLLEQLDGVLARCAAAGVERIVTIGTDLDDDRAAIAVCQGRANVRCAVGIHPNYSADAKVSDVAALRELQADPCVVALGEMGLDYHYDKAPPAHQRAIFEAQLQLAADVAKPVVIHCREAVDDTLAVMRAFPAVPAVFHCFTGTRDEARRIVAAGYLLGFTGAVTFKKNDELRDAVRDTPAERILLETDAPYLTPEPVRKVKTNEPSFTVHTARVVAEVKGASYEEMDRITTANAARFYRWP
ncbi:MAG TPA: TatD family hydrolase [Tepidisphaeraceae bacterium]|nr:TatD family hydrolase [Tepidisphaeraceae bacterium]